MSKNTPFKNKTITSKDIKKRKEKGGAATT
jgi:hypothetical protein